MPLIEELFYNNTKIGVWHITEAEDFFAPKYIAIKAITHNNNRLRHVAAWYTAIKLAGTINIEPYYTPHGAPIDNLGQINISLSHTKNIAIAAINSNFKIGVDVEWVYSKAIFLQQKFANQNDISCLQNTTLPMQEAFSLLWSIKESAYKCMHQIGVEYKQVMTLKTLEMQNPNSFKIFLYWNNVELTGMAYRLNDFWITSFENNF